MFFEGHEKYPEIDVESINAIKNGGSYLKISTERSYLNFGTPCISNILLKKCAVKNDTIRVRAFFLKITP